jgi:hypothetical protein
MMQFGGGGNEMKGKIKGRRGAGSGRGRIGSELLGFDGVGAHNAMSKSKSPANGARRGRVRGWGAWGFPRPNP